MGAEVVIDNRSGRPADRNAVSRVAAAVLARLGYKRGELGVALVTAAEMEELNRRHMGREGATDVLSFPLDAPDADTAAAGEAPLLLGDVIVCPEVAAAQARELGVTEAGEVCLLLVHGILHLAGYDHETDSGAMDDIQQFLVKEFCTQKSERK